MSRKNSLLPKEKRLLEQLGENLKLASTIRNADQIMVLVDHDDTKCLWNKLIFPSIYSINFKKMCFSDVTFCVFFIKKNI